MHQIINGECIINIWSDYMYIFSYISSRVLFIVYKKKVSIRYRRYCKPHQYILCYFTDIQTLFTPGNLETNWLLPQLIPQSWSRQVSRVPPWAVMAIFQQINDNFLITHSCLRLSSFMLNCYQALKSWMSFLLKEITYSKFLVQSGNRAKFYKTGH